MFFTNSGAEANEGAIKLARKWGSLNKAGAYEIITFENSFHGRTLATMSASGKPQFRDLFEPKVPGFPKAKLNDLASVESLVTDKTVAVMLEPVQGEAGVIAATDDFMRDLRETDPQTRTAADRRRNPDRCRPYRQAVGLRTLGHRAGHHDPGQDARRRRTAGSAGGERRKSPASSHGDQGGTFNGNPLMAAVGSAIMDACWRRGSCKVRVTGARN